MRLFETLLSVVIILSVLASLDMLINVPGQDIPDLKDIPALFPNYN